MRDKDGNAPAPEGQIYLCGACGRTNKIRYNMGDTSCVTWACLVYEDSIVRRAEDGHITHATAVPDE